MANSETTDCPLGMACRCSFDDEMWECELRRQIELGKDECRRIARRDGIPVEAINALFDRMEGGSGGTA